MNQHHTRAAAVLITCLMVALLLALTTGATVPDYATTVGPDQCAMIVLSPPGETVTYIALAPPGTAHTTAAWQVKKITTNAVAGTTVITWADGNKAFDNTPGADGAGLAALTYQ